MSLYRCTGQQQIDLIIVVSVPPQVLNDSQASLSIGHSGIEVMLLSLFVDGESFEVDVSSRTELGFDRTRDVNWAFCFLRESVRELVREKVSSLRNDLPLHAQLLHSTLHYRKLDGDDARHLNCTAEGDFSVTLGEVQIAHRELSTFDVNWQVDFTASAQVLDVTITSMFRSTRNGTGTFFSHFLFDRSIAGPDVDIDRLGRLGDITIHVAASGDELAFAFVPEFEHFLGRSAAENAWVNEAGESNARDVARTAVYAFEVPDRFCGLGVDLIKEALHTISRVPSGQCKL